VIQSCTGETTDRALHFCTYFDRNYLSRGLALHESLLRTCPRPFQLWIAAMDDETHAVLARLRLPGVRPIRLAELEAFDPRLAAAKSNRTKVEYYWTCTSAFLLFVLDRCPEAEAVTYVDADIVFYGDPRPIYEEMGAGSVLIIEHRYAAAHAHSAARSGTYNVGLLVFRRDERAMECLRWWRARCIEWCHARLEDGKYGDQKYLDDWPQRFQGVVVGRHPGVGLGPWNLADAGVVRRQGRWTARGQPLVFLHFHSLGRLGRGGFWACDQDYAPGILTVLDLYCAYGRTLERLDRVAESAGCARPAGEQPSWLKTFDMLLSMRAVWAPSATITRFAWRLAARRLRARERATAAGEAYQLGDLAAARRFARAAACSWPAILADRKALAVALRAHGRIAPGPLRRAVFSRGAK
jgi:hypothetical protein